MKILLLGARGSLGTAFLRVASDFPEHNIIGWDKADIDVTDQGLLEKKIAELRPDIIINTVAYNNVDECEKSTEAQVQAELLNCGIVRFLAEVALEYDVLLVHYSSDYVFAGDKREGYDETAEPQPQNNYGLSKWKGERELQRFSGKGLRWYLIRTARLFGPPGLSEETKPNFFDIMLRLAHTQTEVKVVQNECGSFTYTPDLAVATLRLLESDEGYGIYHLINEGVASWYEAAHYFFKKKHLSTPVIAIQSEDLPRPAKRPLYSQLLNTKRPPLRSWQAAVDEYSKTV